MNYASVVEQVCIKRSQLRYRYLDVKELLQNLKHQFQQNRKSGMYKVLMLVLNLLPGIFLVLKPNLDQNFTIFSVHNDIN